MTALIDTIADALVVSLNGATFSQTFTATKSDLPEYELTDMGTLHVTVVPSKRRKTNATRGSTQQECDIDIAVQKRYTEATAQTERDLMKALVDEIEDAVLRATHGGVTCIGIENDAPCGIEAFMRDLNQFTSVMTATYRRIA